jgi:hypothetical protein
MIRVVGIVGRLNSGKNTFANVFVHSGKFTPMAFADPIKTVLQDLFHLPTAELWGSSDARTAHTRELMQVFGTDFARKYDPDIWVNKMEERIHFCEHYGRDLCFPHGWGPQTKEGIIITDLRFPNEAKMLCEKYAATLIKIVRPHSDEIATVEHAQHASETAVLDIPPELITRVIFNTGTQEDLLHEASRMLGEICSP